MKTEDRRLKTEDRRHGDTENGKRKTDSRSPFCVLCFLCLCSLFSVFSIRAAEPVPTELQGVGVTPKLGEMLPLDLTFQNEHGETVALGSFFKEKKPVILALVYYECPNLCTFLLNGAIEGLQKVPMSIGQEFDFVAVSINPQETPALALQKKEAYLKEYGRPQASQGWHFLVGQEENIQKLAASVGFQYRYDEQEKQYAHAAALFIATPEGKVARVLQGIQFNPRDLRLALVESSEGKIGTFTDQVLLFCFRYDPKASKYGLFASNLMKGAGAATLLGLGYLFIRLRRKQHNA
ncbi:MAG: SCO family protein [Deltaproteobacteria bacterium]|nr:SCO family protein [Deltaproteobacteria bacterium]